MIKAAVFDVYGTMLAYNGYRGVDLNHPPRPGLEIILDRLDAMGSIAVTGSDTDNGEVLFDLEQCFRRFPDRRLYVGRFRDIICLNQPDVKDYFVILAMKRLRPEELLVFDDREVNIQSAKELGCKAILVPRYDVLKPDNFNFAEVDLQSY